MIRFGPMQAEGFASIADEKFDWGIEGLNIIQAPNGNGKTKFINDLVWGLFGQTLSGAVEPWKHSRPSSYRGTRVELMIYVGLEEIKIIRYKDFPKFKNSLLLYINDDDEPFDGEKKDIQKQINKIIGYSYELFKNSIIFGQKLKRIISETGPNKKKVFDEAFEVLYIPKAKKLAEAKLQEFRTEELKESGKWDILEKEVDGKQGEIDAEQNMVDNFEADKKKDVKEEREKIKEIRKERHVIEIENPNAEQDLHEYELEQESFIKDAWTNEEIIKKEKKLTKLETQRDQLAEKGVDILQEQELLKAQFDNVPSKCKECGKSFTKSEKEEEKKRIGERYDLEVEHYKQLTNNTSTIKGQIKELDEEIASASKLNESIDSNNKEIERLEGVLKSISDLDIKIQGHKDSIKKIKEKKLENNIKELEIELTDLKVKQKAQKNTVNGIKRDVKTYEWLVRDPLSNAGLKAFIFNQMLDEINDRLEFYTKFIGFQVAFVMDMQSAHKNLETYVFQGEHPVPYDDLSGGQQQRVDISTAFAIHDVVSNTKDCMLLVMDEVFESLDKDNIEIMTDLIQDKAQTKCLYVVTHRAEFNPTNANLIQIDYRDGITSVA